MNYSTFIPLLAGILLGLILILCCQIIYTGLNITVTSWNWTLLRPFSPVKQCFQDVYKYVKIKFNLTVSKSVKYENVVVYILLSGKYLEDLESNLTSLIRNFSDSARFVVVPFDFNEKYAIISYVASCVLSNYGVNSFKMLIEKLNEGKTLNMTLFLNYVNKTFPKCTIENTTKLSKEVVNQSRDVFDNIIPHCLFWRKEIEHYEAYYRGYDIKFLTRPKLLLVVCNTERELCVGSTSDDFRIVFSNVLTQVPIGYENR